MTNTIKVKRAGAGRTKGSFSFVNLSMAEMGGKISDPNFKWRVSRKQAEALGFENLITGRVSDLTEANEGVSVEAPIEVKAVEL